MDMSLSDEQIDFIQGGVSISLASRDVRRVPSVSKAVACRVAADRRRVCVLLDAGQSHTLLRDVASCGALAATFCQPSTHRTLQLKGRDAQEAALQPDGTLRVTREPRGWVPRGPGGDMNATIVFRRR